MKKIYSFIALFLMLFVGSAQAQHRWGIVGENLSDISQLKAGAGNYYVIKEGDNMKADGTTAGHSQDGYLNSLGPVVTEVKHECVFSFIETGEVKLGHKVYILKNLANNQYLVGSGKYTTVKAKAFKFTVQKGEVVENGDTWENYSKSVSEGKSVNAVSLGAWVFCSPDAKSYMCFWGSPEPSISEYNDTNNWLIYEVQEEQMSAHEKLLEIFGQYFANGFDENAYIVGTAPGCVSQDFFDRLKGIYDEAEAATMNPNLDPKECDRIREAIVAIFDEMKTAMIPVSAGYYILNNVDGRGFLTVNGDGSKGCGASAIKGEGDISSWTPEVVTSWNLNNAKYIWQLIDAKEDGKLLFKNFGTGKYLTTSNGFAMSEEDGTPFQVSHYSSAQFTMTYGTNSMLHMSNHADRKLLDYNHPEDPASRWKYYTVNNEIIDSLSAKVEQNAKNQQLIALYNRANVDYLKVQYKNGFVATGAYNAPADSGLVRAFEAANATEPAEGKPEYAFDGKLDTYYHTLWHADQAPQDDWHWVQVDLGKEVQELVVKFSYRHNNNNGNPSRIALVASQDGNFDQSAEWSDTLYKDTVIYAYPTYFPGGKRDSTTCIDTIKLSKPVQHLRMAVTRTKANQIYGAGPCWHVSELRFYDLKECVANPSYVAVPQEVKDALIAALAKAEKEIADKAATTATYEELETALDKFWEAYPDASELKNALDAAKEMAENAQEGSDMGYFKEGAKAALLAKVEEIAAAVAAKEEGGAALSLADIKEFTTQLDAAVDAFNAMLIVPESGKIYRIVSRAGLNDEGEERPQSNTCIVSANADCVNGTPVWRYKTNEEGTDGRLNALWLVEKSEKGYSFKNLANGLYMGNEYEGLTEEELEDAEIRNIVGYSKEPKHFQLESFTAESAMENGSFLIALKKGEYVNLQPAGNVVHWYDRNDPHAPFTFEAVDDQYDVASYTVDVTGGKTQIVTLPITVDAVYNNEQAVYEVLGKKDNTIQLKSIDGPIEAGTPFIVKTQTAEESENAEVENKIYCDVSLNSLDDCLKLSYNYEPVVKNGLVSAPSSFIIPEGTAYGVLYGTTVVASQGGDEVAAATGFFNNTLPETTEEGDEVLIIEGDITGEGTAVDKVEIVKNVPADVYTLSGVKVRQNVKAGAATKGLPKGVYIVGSKKVVVK